MNETETKFHNMQLKELTEEGTFEGYASVFGQVDQGDDVVAKGAFRSSLQIRMPKMLYQHSPDQPIGTWLEAREDDHGLYVRGKILTETSKGAEILALMKAKILDGMSIGFRTIKAMRDEKTGIRTLLEVDLWEISVVTFPMLQSATVDNVKGKWTKRMVEQALRDAGMPNAMAVKLISGGWDAANTKTVQRDAGSRDILAKMRQATEMMKG